VHVVIVGSGLQGVASAWFLTQRGCSVTVLDRENAACRGTSYANAGMLTPSMADPWNEPGVFGNLVRWLGQEEAPFLLRLSALPSLLGWSRSFLMNARPAPFRANMEKNLRLASYSLRVLEELRRLPGLHYDERRNGTIKVFREQQAFDHAMKRNEILAELGLEVRAVSAGEAARIEPALAPVSARLKGGIHCPVDESGDARLFTEGVARLAREGGAQFEFDTQVVGWQHSGDRVTAAISTNGRHAADAFVIAAGSWSPQLVKGLRLSIPVRPVKGYSITVPFGDWESPPQMPVIDDALHTAATPLGRRLRVAGTAELAGYDLSLTPARLENLYRLLLALFPSIAPHVDRALALPWAGLRPVCADGVPLIGRYRYRNLFLNTGHGHLGWTLCAGSARLLADLIAGVAPEIDAAPYDAQRPL
jgi:D-amino-acid dehydrogenase